MDIKTSIRNAFSTIIDGDAGPTVPPGGNTMQSLTGKAGTDLIAVKQSGLADADLPAVGVFVFVTNEVGGVGDVRQVIVQLTSGASGDLASDTVEAMSERLESIISHVNLQALGLDAGGFRRSRPGVSIDEGVLAQDILDVEFTINK